MENNRYREEEKELEEQNQKNKKQDSKEADKLDSKFADANSEDSEFDESKFDESNLELEEEIKKDNKTIKKMKKKIKHLEEESLKLTEQVKNLNDQLLRNRADLENYKRRTNEERIKERKYAMQDFFSEIIDVIDVFDKAVSIKTDDEKLKKYLSGFVMVNSRLKQTLENYGVKKIASLNQEFNPDFHQALEVVEVEGVAPNTIVEVVMEGYMYKDRVLRPSMVKVSK